MSKEQTQKKDNFSSTAELTTNTGFQSTLSVASKHVDDKTYNPFEHRTLDHPNTTIGSVLHLLKACIGTGILAMPAAFKNCGLLSGTIGTIIAGFICTHTVYILVRTSQEVCVDAKKPSMSFAETCGAVFTYGPKKLQTWGSFVKSVVDFSMTLTYISVLCVYVVFIGSSFKEALEVYIPNYEISVRLYCVMMLVPLVLICQIRNLKYLVPFSAVANVLVLVVLGITMYYVFADLPPVSERDLVAPVTQWPLFFSTVVFAMEGIGVVMPIENEMANPRRFLGCPGVLTVSMVIVISLYTIVGFFGYLQFGDEVKGSITLNLPQDEMYKSVEFPRSGFHPFDKSRTYWELYRSLCNLKPVKQPDTSISYFYEPTINIIAQSAQLLMALVMFLSYALQFYVPMEMITRLLKKRQSNSYENIIQVTIRTVLVAITVGVAAAFPNLELVISFVGAIFFSTLGLLVPAVVETVYLWDRDLGKCNYILWKNVIISIISVICLVSGSYSSVVGMIEDFSSGHDDLDIYVNATSTQL